MANITITPEELETQAQEYINKATELEEIRTFLSNHITTLQELWKGTASDKFAEMWETEYQNGLVAVKNMCEGLNQELLQTAEIMRQTDADIASAFGQALNN